MKGKSSVKELERSIKTNHDPFKDYRFYSNETINIAKNLHHDVSNKLINGKLLLEYVFNLTEKLEKRLSVEEYPEILEIRNELPGIKSGMESVQDILYRFCKVLKLKTGKHSKPEITQAGLLKLIQKIYEMKYGNVDFYLNDKKINCDREIPEMFNEKNQYISTDKELFTEGLKSLVWFNYRQTPASKPYNIRIDTGKDRLFLNIDNTAPLYKEEQRKSLFILNPETGSLASLDFALAHFAAVMDFLEIEYYYGISRENKNSFNLVVNIKK